MILPPEMRRPARLPLSRIHDDPDQPRQAFDWDALKELAESMRTNGLWQRVLVRPHPSITNDFMTLDGHRRCRAAAMLQWAEIDAEVVDVPLDEGRLLLVQTSLGLTSRRLDPIDTGAACQRLMAQFKLSPAELAQQLLNRRLYTVSVRQFRHGISGDGHG